MTPKHLQEPSSMSNEIEQVVNKMVEQDWPPLSNAAIEGEEDVVDGVYDDMDEDEFLNYVYDVTGRFDLEGYTEYTSAVIDALSAQGRTDLAQALMRMR